ncbi:carboxypeptidase-like regulatory domain-containing protein [Deinococcus sonorensis]|uniref:Carboxypeptidase-like regulatory domain-containing protein n=2 Tax=Deinococcus sonorensis TaxID=309891 RepID=A0AAU7UCR1_9DEIO
MRNVLVLATVALTLSACGGSSVGAGPSAGGGTPVPGPVGAAANTVAGQVLDERGAPVADARIIIEPAMFRGTFFAFTNAQGRYQSVPLNTQTAPYYATAFKEVTYNGRHYCVRMAPNSRSDAEAFNPANGAVRSFTWKMTGDTGEEGDAVWGGTVAFNNLINATEDQMVDWDATVEVKFVPDGPLIDGSTGKTVIKTGTLRGGVRDIPVGRYTVSAMLVDGPSKTPLKIATHDADALTTTETSLMFNGFDTCGHSGTFSSTPLWVSR